MGRFGLPYRAITFILLPAAMSLYGCSESKVPEHAIDPAAIPVNAVVEETSSTLDQQAANQVAQARGNSLNVLVLSGGGAHGAWGAGVLNGWKDSGRDIPKWDVVTGISTGSLQATAAFLGDYETLHRFYTKIRTSDVVTPNFLGIQFLAAIWSHSLYDSKPLRKLLQTVVSNDIIDRVAAESRRKLYVGTVDLNDGRLYIWDMTALAVKARASKSPYLYDRYRNVILASSSVPGAFPAVKIDGEPHGDGGTRAQLFFREKFLRRIQDDTMEYRRHPTTMRSHLSNLNVHVWVLVNGRLGNERVNASGTTINMALRGVEILEDAAATGDLFAIKEMPGLDFRYVSEPVDAPPLTVGEFDGKEMLPLYNLGHFYGEKGLWNTYIDFAEVSKGALR